MKKLITNYLKRVEEDQWRLSVGPVYYRENMKYNMVFSAYPLAL